MARRPQNSAGECGTRAAAGAGTGSEKANYEPRAAATAVRRREQGIRGMPYVASQHVMRRQREGVARRMPGAVAACRQAYTAPASVIRRRY